MHFKIAVVVVTYNSGPVVGALLDSLGAALGDITADIVVVDNGSSDDTCRQVEARTDCRLVRSTNEGYAAGLNRGARSAPDAGAILLLNPDTILGPASIAPLLDRLDTPGVGVVVPRVLDADGNLHHSLRREPTLARALGLSRTGLAVFSEYIVDEEAYRSAGTVDWALGAVMMMSRACFESTGGWDPSYFLYSEETDFCLRVRDLGWRTVYEPASTIVHIGGLSGRNDQTHAMQIINRVRLYARRHRAPSAYCYLGLTVLSEVSWMLRGHRQSRFAVRALVQPKARPGVLGCDASLLPR